MRLALIVAVALALTPAALMAHPAGLQAPATDISAAKKKPRPVDATPSHFWSHFR